MEKPAIFNSEMVRAILDGRKLMTRRICKDQSAEKYMWVENTPMFPTDDKLYTGWAKDCGFDYLLPVKCPYKKGMYLWVRETFVTGTHIGHAPWVRYRATDEEDVPEDTKWKPSIFMPRKLSRINLEIEHINVEQIQDITEEDALAEGIGKRIGSSSMGHTFTGVEHFHALWDSINKKRGYGWAENPWCWVISFGQSQ